ncbi:MAG: hypothetical protein ACYSX0_22235 [Planctomycetota bacterium]|jgi:hypothetical protein
MRAAFLLLFLCGMARAGTFPGYEDLRREAKRLWSDKRADAYLILVPKGSPLNEAAKVLAKHRGAEIVLFNPKSPEDSLKTLIRKGARYVAVFVEPGEMDVNLVRKLIVLSTLMDEDPFCDFAFGFFTATAPEKVKAFVQRAIRADKKGVKPYSMRLSASNISRLYPSYSFLDGVPGESWFVAQGDIAYAEKAMAEFGRAGFVHFGGCADPEGIWLFDDKRNLDRSKHWPYDPDTVGQDPEGEMPRVTAEHFRALKLDHAVVWTHACHIGSVGRIWVEGDIVSTFGRCEKVEEYRIPESRSVGIAIIESGASAYIAPLGPNFGAQSAIEQTFAAETGAPLGDVLRHAYHDVVMDTGGHPERIGIYVTGKPARWDPDGFVNYNSPHNRALYGDPLFRPFGDRRAPATVRVESQEDADGIDLVFRLEKSGYLGRTWYGNRGHKDPGRGRIYEVIPLRAAPSDLAVDASKAQNSKGESFVISNTTALVERIDGKVYLHLQLVTDDPKALREKGATVKVRVGFGGRRER